MASVLSVNARIDEYGYCSCNGGAPDLQPIGQKDTNARESKTESTLRPLFMISCSDVVALNAIGDKNRCYVLAQW